MTQIRGKCISGGTVNSISYPYHVFRKHVSDVHRIWRARSQGALLAPPSSESPRLGLADALQPGPNGHNCPLQDRELLLTFTQEPTSDAPIETTQIPQ